MNADFRELEAENEELSIYGGQENQCKTNIAEAKVPVWLHPGLPMLTIENLMAKDLKISTKVFT